MRRRGLPNESEAWLITDLPDECGQRALGRVQAIEIAGRENRRHHTGGRTVASCVTNQHSRGHVPPFAVTAVDTTAAGDAFAGALDFVWLKVNHL